VLLHLTELVSIPIGHQSKYNGIHITNNNLKVLY